MDYKTILSNPEGMGLLKRAIELYKALIQFDNDIRAVSNEELRGLGDTEPQYAPALINIGDGWIDLDLRDFGKIDPDRLNLIGQHKGINKNRTTKVYDSENSVISVLELMRQIDSENGETTEIPENYEP